jgi:hypothetical protein
MEEQALTSVFIESLSMEVLEQITVTFEPLYVAICILIMLNIAILGVLIWKR